MAARRYPQVHTGTTNKGDLDGGAAVVAEQTDEILIQAHAVDPEPGDVLDEFAFDGSGGLIHE